MDHPRVPVPEALQEFRRRGDAVHGPPGHEQGPGAGYRVVPGAADPAVGTRRVTAR
ncbi:hypothetical protein GCM10010421_48130 [Streptomyces glaucus]|uniref:Uncharacterized protein n=1 Tax=Streptomyces glaucus TaxID=284029 RepID=A0ABN3K5K4_9ACTN